MRKESSVWCRTLVIGLGGYGCNKITTLRNLFGEDENVLYLGIDTDSREEKELRDITVLSPAFQLNRDAVCPEFRDWYDDQAPYINTLPWMKGCGGLRIMARFVFEASLATGRLEAEIQAALDSLCLTGTAEKLQIMIICSLAGGSGSGMFLPLAHYLKQTIRKRYPKLVIPIKGFFALPEAAVPFFDRISCRRMEANAYAALTELKALNWCDLKEDSSLWNLKVNGEPHSGENGSLFQEVFLLDTRENDHYDAAYGIYVYLLASCQTFLAESNLAAATYKRYADTGFLYDIMDVERIRLEEPLTDSDEGGYPDLAVRLLDRVQAAGTMVNHTLEIRQDSEKLTVNVLLVNPRVYETLWKQLDSLRSSRSVRIDITENENIPDDEIDCLMIHYRLTPQESDLLDDSSDSQGTLYFQYLQAGKTPGLHIDKRIGTRFLLPRLTGTPDDYIKMQRAENIPGQTGSSETASAGRSPDSAGYALISYSHKQRAAVDAIRMLLNRNGIRTWMAPGDIPPGSKYAAEINRAIKHCACFILMLTNDAQKSQWVEREIERAINYNKMIIPVQLENVVLNDQFELYLSTDQMIAIEKIDDQSEEVSRLLAVVGECVRQSCDEQES